MKEKILTWLRGESFVKDTMVLMTGTAIAQSIPILVSPILTRIYSAEQFGLLSIVSFIVFFLGALSALKYELAIVIPHNDTDADNVYFLSVIISFLINAFLFIVFFFTARPIAHLLKAPGLAPFLPWTAMVGFFLLFFNATNYYLIRQRRFTSVAANKITRTSSTAALQILFGLTKIKTGLVLGFGTGQIAGNSINFFKIPFGKIIRNIKKIKLIALAKRFRKFPAYSFPANVLYRLSVETYNFILPILFDIKVLGFYYLAYRMTIAPITFIGQSISDVFLKRASDELKKKGHLKDLFHRLIWKVVGVSLPIYLLLFFFAEPIFSIIFGHNWYTAGLFAKILAPWLFFRFLFFTFAQTFTILEKLNYSLILQSINLLIAVIIFFLAYWYKWDIHRWIITFSIVMSGLYLAGFALIYLLILRQYRHALVRGIAK